MQLGPVVRSPVAAAAGLGESMLERLISYYQALPEGIAARALCTLLVRNYRSHELLLKLPSNLFYGSALQACAPQDKLLAPAWSVLGTASAPLSGCCCCCWLLCMTKTIACATSTLCSLQKFLKA
jgi:AAA domain